MYTHHAVVVPINNIVVGRNRLVSAWLGNASAIIAALACERSTEDGFENCTLPALKESVYIMKFTSVPRFTLV